MPWEQLECQNTCLQPMLWPFWTVWTPAHLKKCLVGPKMHRTSNRGCSSRTRKRPRETPNLALDQAAKDQLCAKMPKTMPSSARSEHRVVISSMEGAGQGYLTRLPRGPDGAASLAQTCADRSVACPGTGAQVHPTVHTAIRSSWGIGWDAPRMGGFWHCVQTS